MPIGRAGEVWFLLACKQQTHFRSSLLSLSLPPSLPQRRERSDDRKCVCCSQARFLSMVDWVEYEPFVAKKKEIKIVNKQAATVESLIDGHRVKNVIS